MATISIDTLDPRCCKTNATSASPFQLVAQVDFPHTVARDQLGEKSLFRRHQVQKLALKRMRKREKVLQTVSLWPSEPRWQPPSRLQGRIARSACRVPAATTATALWGTPSRKKKSPSVFRGFELCCWSKRVAVRSRWQRGCWPSPGRCPAGRWSVPRCSWPG